MLYKIIGDSCMDLTEELKLDPHFQMVPLTLQIGDYKVTDDETFNQKEFLAKVKASSECPKTACPSPESFKEAFEGDARIYFRGNAFEPSERLLQLGGFGKTPL